MRNTYASQHIIPCQCGSKEPYWHGTIIREYCCDDCWKQSLNNDDNDNDDDGETL